MAEPVLNVFAEIDGKYMRIGSFVTLDEVFPEFEFV